MKAPFRIRSGIWSRDSGVLLGGFFLAIALILYIWRPLAVEYMALVDWDGEWWRQLDWLLLGVFLLMSITIVAGADLRADALIIAVGALGGLTIESWGTQTNLWSYYTGERPPLWILPAWPIASLSISRITRAFAWVTSRYESPLVPGAQHSATSDTEGHRKGFGLVLLYWCTFGSFLILLVDFVAPTMDKPATSLSVLLCLAVVLMRGDPRQDLSTFFAGAGLGFFLELWGTTRECWIYYTHETPPVFAVFAHGMASVVFGRAGALVQPVARLLSRLHARGAKALRALPPRRV